MKIFLLFALLNLAFSQLPNSRDAKILKITSSEEVLVEATGKYISEESLFKKKKDVAKNGYQGAIDDAKKAAIYYLLFSSQGPLLSTDSQKVRFEQYQSYYFNTDNTRSYIVWEEQSVRKKISIDGGNGIKIIKRFKVNKSKLIKDLEGHRIISSQIADKLLKANDDILNQIQRDHRRPTPGTHTISDQSGNLIFKNIPLKNIFTKILSKKDGIEEWSAQQVKDQEASNRELITITNYRDKEVLLAVSSDIFTEIKTVEIPSDECNVNYNAESIAACAAEVNKTLTKVLRGSNLDNYTKMDGYLKLIIKKYYKRKQNSLIVMLKDLIDTYERYNISKDNSSNQNQVAKQANSLVWYKGCIYLDYNSNGSQDRAAQSESADKQKEMAALAAISMLSIDKKESSNPLSGIALKDEHGLHDVTLYLNNQSKTNKLEAITDMDGCFEFPINNLEEKYQLRFNSASVRKGVRFGGKNRFYRDVIIEDGEVDYIPMIWEQGETFVGKKSVRGNYYFGSDTTYTGGKPQSTVTIGGKQVNLKKAKWRRHAGISINKIFSSRDINSILPIGVHLVQDIMPTIVRDNKTYKKDRTLGIGLFADAYFNYQNRSFGIGDFGILLSYRNKLGISYIMRFDMASAIFGQDDLFQLPITDQVSLAEMEEWECDDGYTLENDNRTYECNSKFTENPEWGRNFRAHEFFKIYYHFKYKKYYIGPSIGLGYTSGGNDCVIQAGFNHGCGPDFVPDQLGLITGLSIYFGINISLYNDNKK